MALLGGCGASLKFRQFISAVFDALGCFLLVCLVGGVLLLFSSFEGWGI